MSILDRDSLGAFCRHTHVAVEGASSGPLAGLSFGVKDIYAIAGHRTGFGSPDWFSTHGPAAATAPVVQRLLDAGASIAGKTHTDEMTYSLIGENAHYGTPVNVNAPGRVPGGSSSGSAAAVAGALVDFALGSDTGGSVRIPASFCGIFGMRPTHERIALTGACPLAPSFDTCGWFARDAALLERVGCVLFGSAPERQVARRLLIAEDAFDAAGAEVGAALAPALERVTAVLGAGTRIDVSGRKLAEWAETFRVLQAAEVWATHAEWVTRARPQFGPGIRERFDAAARISPQQVERGQAERERIRSRLDALLEPDVLLCLPAAPGIAPLRNTAQAELNDFRSRMQRLTCIAGLAGLPQISLPLARLDGAPLGLSLMGARGADTLLLASARAVASDAAVN